MTRSVPIVLAASSLFAVPAAASAQAVVPGTLATRLTDAELARVTGKFILPNGVELALTITTDTVVNGQLLLRTVLTVDKTSQLQVLGRQQGMAPIAYTGATAAASVGGGVTVELDRKSGIQTVTPTISATVNPAVSVGTVSQNGQTDGLLPLALVPGGPAVATADGVVSLEAARNGSRVTFEGAQLAIVNLVGQSVATALLNSADNRTLDTVTNIGIDARNIAPYQAGIAQMRASDLALDATRGMIR